MCPKKRLIIVFLSILLAQTYSSNLSARIKFNLCVKGGFSLSQLVEIPENLHEHGKRYQLSPLPGGVLAGEFKIRYKTLSILSGVGFKSLNFDFIRNFNAEQPQFINKSKSYVRMRQLFLPFSIDIPIIPKYKLFIPLSAEFCWLINNYNQEILEWPGPIILNHKIHDWFKPNSLFLFLGIGKEVKSKFSIIFQTGVTTGFIEQKQAGNEGAIEGFFYFQKKLLEYRLLLSYDISNLN